MFVKLRKRLVRAYLITQVENEIFDRIRKKCFYRIYRDAFPSNQSHRKIVKKHLLKMDISHYHFFRGNQYLCNNKNPKADEIEDIWLMIPNKYLDNFSHPDLPPSIKKKEKKTEKQDHTV